MNTGADDPQSPLRLAAFLQGLSELGWIDGRNVRIEYRWGAGDPERYRRYAAELVALAPDVILTPAAPIVGVLQQATRTVPIVFAGVIRPSWCRFGREPGAAGRQRHRIYPVRVRREREMAGTAQGDRARCETGGNHS